MADQEIITLQEILLEQEKRTAEYVTTQETAKHVLAEGRLSTNIRGNGLIVILATRITKMPTIPEKRGNATLVAGKEK